MLRRDALKGCLSNKQNRSSISIFKLGKDGSDEKFYEESFCECGGDVGRFRWCRTSVEH